jgi:hypothetical protein
MRGRTRLGLSVDVGPKTLQEGELDLPTKTGYLYNIVQVATAKATSRCSPYTHDSHIIRTLRHSTPSSRLFLSTSASHSCRNDYPPAQLGSLDVESSVVGHQQNNAVRLMPIRRLLE